MSRVDITGQFTPGQKFMIDREEVKINREVLLRRVPRNWTQFCTKIDQALEEYTKAKTIMRRLRFISLLALFVLIVGPILGIFPPEESSVLILPAIFFSCKVYCMIGVVAMKIRQICVEFSGTGDGVRYELGQNASFGFSVTYFIIVHYVDEEDQSSQIQMSFVARSTTNTTSLDDKHPCCYDFKHGSSSSNEISHVSPTAIGTGQKSVFDQLNNEM